MRRTVGNYALSLVRQLHQGRFYWVLRIRAMHGVEGQLESQDLLFDDDRHGDALRAFRDITTPDDVAALLADSEPLTPEGAP